jgi:hypothetical protein
LQVAIEEAHARGMTPHAWVNPYRIGADASRAVTTDVFEADGKLYYIPSAASTHETVTAGVRELVENYDIDGVQFDDYFYPEGAVPDAAPAAFEEADYTAYRQSGGHLSVADRRRAAVNRLVAAVYDICHGREGCVFGISPAYDLEKNFSEKEVDCSEIASNVLSADASDIIRDFKSVLLDSTEEEIMRALDFITIDSSKLKTLKGKPHPILPIWDKENRDERYLVKPLLKNGEKYVYSPIVLDETRKRWINGITQFNPPYEIGLPSLIEVIKQWKERYEHIFSYDIKKWFEDKGYDYADNDIDIRRKDRKGNHPPINELGDYDVIALDRKSKTIYLIECKVLQPIRSIFEHSLEQKRFFNTEKFDEKFQKRINYFMGVFKSYFENLGYPLGDDEYKVVPLMVVNKVFDSYFKKVDFKIITFDELKKIVK